MQKVYQSPFAWTCEEINLMAMYDTSSRNALITEIADSLLYVDDPDMRAFMETVISKVEAITDYEFYNIGFYPTFMD